MISFQRGLPLLVTLVLVLKAAILWSSLLTNLGWIDLTRSELVPSTANAESELQFAESLFKRAVNSFDSNSRALYGLGLTYRRQGRSELALASLRRGSVIDPSFPLGYFFVGQLYADLGQEQIALESWRQHPQIADHFLTKGIASFNAGHSEESASDLSWAVQIRPRTPKAHDVLIAIFDRETAWDQLVEELEAATRLYPENEPWNLKLGLVYLSRFSYLDQAEERFNRVLSLTAEEPDSRYRFWALVGLGQVELRRGNAARAVQLLEEAILMQPDNSEGLDYLGQAYMDNGDWSSALRVYSKLVYLGHHTKSVYNRLGTIYLEMGMPERADEMFERARRTAK